MQRTRDLGQPDEDSPKKTGEKGFACDQCGTKFPKPIFATILTGGQKQTYYACPRCMTKVQNFKLESKKNEETPFSPKGFGMPKAEPAGTFKCGHFFGYLSKHQKNTPFPDECLTCSRMFECMRH